MANKLFDFKGTSNRSEYWAVVIIANIVAFVCMYTGMFLLGTDSPGDFTYAFGAFGAFVIVLGACWVQLATVARRCRDAGITAWWCLATFVPWVSYVALIVFGCLAPAVTVSSSTSKSANLSSSE